VIARICRRVRIPWRVRIRRPLGILARRSDLGIFARGVAGGVVRPAHCTRLAHTVLSATLRPPSAWRPFVPALLPKTTSDPDRGRPIPSRPRPNRPANL